MAGCFQDTVDFNPAGGGTLTAPRGTNGFPNNDAFLCKYDSDGNFKWARNWGGNGGDEAYHADVDGVSNVFEAGNFVGSVDFGPLIGGGAANPSFYGASDAFLAQIPTCWKLSVVKSGNGWSSVGGASSSVQMISLGVTTQVVYTADDWYRILTLASNSTVIGAAASMRIYTQAFVNVATDISNDVTFAMATTNQTGYPNVPTVWLTNWAENAIISDPTFDVHGKYLIGLDPTTTTTFELMIESFSASGSNAITVLKRTHTGGLSPDGMHGQLELQTTDLLGSVFTNVAGTAVTGASVFDGAGRKVCTNRINETGSFLRAVIQ
ncbi:MAG: hypothetical protein V2A34_16615 [Lentisphaerota bacterium]